MDDLFFRTRGIAILCSHAFPMHQINVLYAKPLFDCAPLLFSWMHEQIVGVSSLSSFFLDDWHAFGFIELASNSMASLYYWMRVSRFVLPFAWRIIYHERNDRRLKMLLLPAETERTPLEVSIRHHKIIKWILARLSRTNCKREKDKFDGSFWGDHCNAVV